MNVLLISDSHGTINNIRQAIFNEPSCKMIFFLGDGLSDIEKCKVEFPERQFVTVKGNNDFGFNELFVAYKYVGCNTVVCAHGHTYDVKYTLMRIIDHAESVKANAVFYGHTHKAKFYRAPNGICAVNPGAMYDGRYAVVTLEKDNIDVKFKSIYE